MSLPIATTLTAILTLWFLVLTWRIILIRRGQKISLGHGGDAMLERRIRAQGNLVETAPFCLLLVGLIELQAGSTLLLAAIAVIFALGRLAHGFAFSFTEQNMAARVSGMLLTLIGLALAALYALAVAFGLTG